MVIRIVKMSFAKENEKAFRDLFFTHYHDIRNVEGCTHLDLLRHENYGSVIYFTYSHWEHEDYLEKYKDSDLFSYIWPRTKELFNAKPEAWTTHKQTP